MAAVLLIFVVCFLSFFSADGQDATQNVTGPDILVTDGTRNLTLTCHAGSFPVIRYVWLTPAPETTRCEIGPTPNVCTFTPRLEDNNHSVICLLIDSDGYTLSRALYQVNLQYPPQSKPNITIEPSKKEPLAKGDIITCTVSGGKPRVTSVTFYCRNPDHKDQDDIVNGDGRSVSSSINVDTSKATEQDMECTCNANWDPEPGLYRDQTIMSFELESPPREFGTSYDQSSPLILAATGRTIFFVAYPTPDTTKSYFIRTNMTKEPAPDNTFTTQFTDNSTMKHLVNCRVTPYNVPEEKLGLYELSISNRLGDVSVFVNVTSPVIQHSEEKAFDQGVIVGGVIGGIVLLVGIVTIVIFVIRRKRAGIKGQNDKTSKTPTMTPAATLHVVQPDPNNKINACPSSTFIDSNGGTNDNREQDDYNHLNENTAPPVDSSTYSRVGDDSRGAQQEGSADSATHTSIASHPDQPTDMVIGPKGDVYATVAPKSKGGNPSTTDEVHT